MMLKGRIEGFKIHFRQKIKDKNIMLQEVLVICQKEMNADISNKGKDKYSWMIDFVNYELSTDNSRGFSQFKI